MTPPSVDGLFFFIPDQHAFWRRSRVFLGTKAPWLCEWKSRGRLHCASCACTWRRIEKTCWQGTPSTSSSRRKPSLRTRQAGESPSSGGGAMCRVSLLALLALLLLSLYIAIAGVVCCWLSFFGWRCCYLFCPMPSHDPIMCMHRQASGGPSAGHLREG